MGMTPPLIDSTFDTSLARLFDLAKANHTKVDLGIAEFKDHVAPIVIKCSGLSPAVRSPADLLCELNTGDLFLSAACALGRETAWERFRALYHAPISDTFSYFNRTRQSAGCLADSLISDLYLPDRSGRSRIASYDGRSSLTTWLRTIAKNQHINKTAKGKYEACSSEVTMEPRDEQAVSRMERGLYRSRYKNLLEEALTEACGILGGAERKLLLWRYDDNLRLGEVAHLVGIHQSNVTRLIDKLCVRLRERVALILENEKELPAAAVEECLIFAIDELSDSIHFLKVLRKASENCVGTRA
jgi:RNA polymerase sigma-70 factor